jgi:hypothetical protein
MRSVERWPSAAAGDQHPTEGKRLLEKHAIAPSAARLCYVALMEGSVCFARGL